MHCILLDSQLQTLSIDIYNDKINKMPLKYAENRKILIFHISFLKKKSETPFPRSECFLYILKIWCMEVLHQVRYQCSKNKSRKINFKFAIFEI